MGPVVSCLCCDQETSWFRNILVDIIGYYDCVFQINLKSWHLLTFNSMNLLSGSYHCMRKTPWGVAPHRYLNPL